MAEQQIELSKNAVGIDLFISLRDLTGHNPEAYRKYVRAEMVSHLALFIRDKFPFTVEQIADHPKGAGELHQMRLMVFSPDQLAVILANKFFEGIQTGIEMGRTQKSGLETLGGKVTVKSRTSTRSIVLVVIILGLACLMALMGVRF